MSNKKESHYFSNLRSYTEGKTYVNLINLLECRLDTLKEACLTADDAEVKKIQGQAKEIKYLLKSLTREPMKQQHTGAFV